MTIFLEHIITQSGSAAQDPNSLYIFPNRRAGLHFKQLLTRHIEKPIWSPTVMSGADLIESIYRPHSIADNLTLLFELYVVYQQVAARPESFDKFFPWGSMMLKDFDEADRYLIDGDRLFQNVRDLRELEDRFRTDLKEEEAFVAFWQTFSHEPLDQWRQQFAAIWQELGRLYKSFRSHLQTKQLAYEGMAYRHLAEDLTWIDSLSYQQVFICGFNALSTSEKVIFKALESQKSAQLFWDADTWYLDNPDHEAGIFLRENFKEGFQRPDHINSPLTEQPKAIDVVGIPGGHGQVYTAVEQLQRWRKETDFVPEETAIVLGDESLLFPLLYALPEDEALYNITMGYPLVQAFTYTFIEQVLQLQVNTRGSQQQPAFNHRQVSALLQHPYVAHLAGESASTLNQTLIDKKRLFPTVSWLQESDNSFLQLLFTPQNDTGALLAYLQQLLLAVSDFLAQHPNSHLSHEPAFLLQYYKMLTRLEELLDSFDGDLSKELLQKLLHQLASGQTLPFSGEPVKGIQIMGLLETRLLDFKRIILLSVNEGQLPNTNRHHSYIPYGIRKAFGMPTFEQQDGLSAYHFYRLLQRSNHALLLHNTIPGRMSEGEPSRFLKQLEFEWQPVNPALLTFSRTLATVPPQFGQSNAIRIDKNQSILDKLKLYTSEKRLSASAINTYITCPLRFYFSYVAGIKEKDELEESIDAATLGTIFHNAMESLYRARTGKAIDQHQLAAWREDVKGTLLEQYRAHYEGTMQKPEGKNVLNYTFLKESAEAIFDYEATHIPFTLLEVEKEHKAFFTFTSKEGPLTVSFIGLFDREDEKEGIHYILDYKTGSTVNLDKKAIQEPNLLRDNPDKKATVQGLLYAWLYLANHPSDTVKVGFYHLRELKDGPKWLSDEPLTKNDLSPFVSFLGELLAEIFDPAVAFTQTTDHKRCAYCPFKQVCDR